LSTSSPKVLVADTDEVVVALISHILARQGYSVDVALTAETAAACMRQRVYGAILLDSKLAGALDGFPERTILLSPTPSSDLPVCAVLQKPVEFGLLIDTVAECVK
jgi:DNA-binding response OmpR family regulator